MKNKIYLILLSLFSSPVFSADDFANEFYAYGNFDGVVNGFTRIALIFNNSDYSSLLYSVVFIGILVGVLVALGKESIGQGNSKSTMSVFFIPLLGVALFKACMLPTTTMHIYDPVGNRYQSVGGVPSFIGFLTQGVNILERFSTDTFSTSDTSRDKHANGTTLRLFLDYVYTDPIKNNHHLKSNLRNYLEACLPIALASDSNDFDFDVFQTTSTDLVSYISKLKSSSVFLTFTSDSAKGGQTISCSTAYTNLLAELNSPATYDKHLEDVCNKSSFDTSNAAGIAHCKTRLNEIMDIVVDDSVTSSLFGIAGSVAISNSLFELMADNKGSAIAALGNKRQVTEGFGNVIVAEGWLPTMRYNTMLIILALIPFLALMFLTPMLFKSLHMITTLLLFIGIWGLVDSIMHDIIFDQILDMLMEFKHNGGGVQAMLMAPNELQKALALFGKQQSMGVMIATLFTAIFFKMSAHSFANMGEKLGSNIDKTGSASGEETLDPSRNMQMIEGYSGASAKHDLHSEVGTERFGRSSGYSSQEGLRRNDAYLEDITKGNLSYNDAYKLPATIAGTSLSGSTQAVVASSENSGASVSDYSSNTGFINKGMDNAEVDRLTDNMAHTTVHNDGSSTTTTPSTNNQRVENLSEQNQVARREQTGAYDYYRDDINKGVVDATTSTAYNSGTQNSVRKEANEEGNGNYMDNVTGLGAKQKEYSIDQEQATRNATETEANFYNMSTEDIQDRTAQFEATDKQSSIDNTKRFAENIESTEREALQAQRGNITASLSEQQMQNLAKNTGVKGTGAGQVTYGSTPENEIVTSTVNTGNASYENNNEEVHNDVIDTARNTQDYSTNTDNSTTISSGIKSNNLGFINSDDESRIKLIEESLENDTFNNIIKTVESDLITSEQLHDEQSLSNVDAISGGASINGYAGLGNKKGDDTPIPYKPPITDSGSGSGAALGMKPKPPQAPESGGKGILGKALDFIGVDVSANVKANAAYNKNVSDSESTSSKVSVNSAAQALNDARLAAIDEHGEGNIRAIAEEINNTINKLQEMDEQRLKHDFDSDFTPISDGVEAIKNVIPDSMQDSIKYEDEDVDDKAIRIN